MGVHDTADLGEGPVQGQVGGRVRRRPKRPLHDPAIVEGDPDDLFETELVACHATRLDEQHAPVTVEPADVAERQRHEARPAERLVGLPDGFADGA